VPSWTTLTTLVAGEQDSKPGLRRPEPWQGLTVAGQVHGVDDVALSPPRRSDVTRTAEIRTDTNNAAWSTSPSTFGTSQPGVQRQARRLSEGGRLEASLLPRALCVYSMPSTFSMNPEKIQEDLVKRKSNLAVAAFFLDTMRQ